MREKLGRPVADGPSRAAGGWLGQSGSAAEKIGVGYQSGGDGGCFGAKADDGGSGGVMPHAVLVLAVAALATAAAATPGHRVPEPDTLAAVFARSRDLALEDRLVAVTDPLLGAAYSLGPLGEGAAGGPDGDPRLRYDAFDCTTFVETAIAMAFAARAEEVEPLLDAIRYRDSIPAFVNRRHFPAAEWIPELVELGILEDITREVAGADVRSETTILSPWVWERRKARILEALPAERIPNGKFPLDVWPLESALAGYRSIPGGSVLSIMRTDRPRLPVRITHQGLVIIRDGERFLRHAADAPYDRVVDEPLEAYLKRIRAYREWSVVGIHIARIAQPPNFGSPGVREPDPIGDAGP